ncbi:quinohemoprotein amine dehydrogenase [Geobacillus thermodenitrificans]|uniref:quinohemoprotein amine dehydrogenase n=1 Tax=Geobacillus thermodenitrificans TaxID=33940 RepID=UPI0034C6AEFE
MKKGMRLLCFLAIVLFPLVLPFHAEGATKTKEMLYIGGLDYVFAVDPKTKKVKEIPVKGAARNMTWTEDGQKLFVVTGARQTVTVIDTLKNEVMDVLPFSSGSSINRIYGLAVDPKGNYLYTTVMRAQRIRTELKALPPVIQVMDVKRKKIVKEIDVPWGTHTLQFFKDGKRIAVWARDLYVYDVEKDVLQLYYPIMYPADVDQGIGNVLYFWDRSSDSHFLSVSTNYKFYPKTEKTTEGILTLDLVTGEVKEYEFNGEMLGLFSGAVTKDRKYAYVGMNMIAKVNLQTGKYERVVPNVPGTSYGFNISGDDKTLYVSGAGPDISFYDAQTLELLDTIPLRTDTMDVRVIQIQQP